MLPLLGWVLIPGKKERSADQTPQFLRQGSIIRHEEQLLQKMDAKTEKGVAEGLRQEGEQAEN